MTRGAKWLVVTGTATTLALLPGTALADRRHGGSSQGSYEASGKQSDGAIESRITYAGSTRPSGSSSEAVTPVGDWTPPACWYEPMSVAEFAGRMEKAYDTVVNDPRQPNYAKAGQAEFRDAYKDGKYHDYNKDDADKGSWWVATQDDSRLDEPGAWECDKLPFWVDNGVTPAVKNAVTPQILAELAYNRIKLPNTKVTFAPTATTKVNLPTWAWLDKARFKQVSVTAALNAAGVSIQATTTAKPVSLKLEPGTTDAETHPASGACTINDDGSIGEPYAKGKADRTPPCGITYLRSSGDGTYTLRATITWAITWTGTGGAGGDLPDGTFGTTQDVTVQEIQSVNR
ncbi:hypothetical protein ABZT03_04985 [Streptomyces sp. NPDC005574]|uniref:hypothetical protein n=1 Tax=Streptomyces sp. NPDC005574 TaxID=3156891 RepID=UPI0033B7E616